MENNQLIISPRIQSLCAELEIDFFQSLGANKGGVRPALWLKL